MSFAITAGAGFDEERRSGQCGEGRYLLGVACDAGPRDCLLAMKDEIFCLMPDPRDQRANDAKWWLRELGNKHYAGLIVGTSESKQGRRVESIVRRAAAERQKPIFVLEDYPGNFCHMEDAPTCELAVESDVVDSWQHSQGFNGCPKILVWPTPRYDRYRSQREILRQTLGTATCKAPVALWAGQPETDANIASLGPLLPALKALGVKIHFKAHPKDLGYPNHYSVLFESAGLDVDDVTSLTVNQAMQKDPSLVITQYSSVAVEAGFYGIPSLHVLFNDVARAALLRTKGYAEPFWVQAGAAASLKDASDAPAMLSHLFYDDGYRALIIERFDRYFCSHPGNARELAARWLNTANNIINLTP